MLKQRIATGLVLVTGFLLALFAESPVFFVGICVALILSAAWEWSALAEVKGTLGRLSFVLLVAMLLGFVAANLGVVNVAKLQVLEQSIWFMPAFYFSGLFWLLGFVLIISYPASQPLWSSRLTRIVLGILLLIGTWIALLYTRFHLNGQFWVVYVVTIVAAADVGAYFVGKMLGKNKLVVAVSPGKTREGFFGGIIASQLLAPIFYFTYVESMYVNTLPVIAATGASAESSLAGVETPAISLGLFMLVSGLVASVSVLGDLFESMLKRCSGIKDSGSIFPGHGGVLDRIDGLTSAFPIFALVLLTLGW